jgi:Protein of unknown function (DUF1501)
MKLTRRDALSAALFGGGMIGLRSLVTGLPAKFLMNPKKALADMTDAGCVAQNPQFIIFNTSGQGDPFACNAPGTYNDGGWGTGMNFGSLVHPSDAQSGVTGIDPQQITLGGRNYQAAGPWTMLGAGTGNANVLGQTSVCHIMTDTPVHPKEPQVLELMGATQYQEMFPSLLAKSLGPCLGTLQTQPISIGALTPSEALSFAGQALPTIPPSALKATLTNPTGMLSNSKVMTLRDQTLQQMHDWYENGGVQVSAAQKQYLDSYITAQSQVRGISQSMLSMLDSIGGKGSTSNSDQITAAIALILMNVAPVIAVHFPFGGDNHSDANFANEAAQTVTGMQAIRDLFNQLPMAANGVKDLTQSVSFLSLNVFGRTMDAAQNTSGRNHNPNHEVSMMIGPGFNGGVYGGVNAPNTNAGQTAGDWACMPINSTTGAPSTSGDITPVNTLASWAKTAMRGVGIDDATVEAQIQGGTVIQAALKSS